MKVLRNLFPNQWVFQALLFSFCPDLSGKYVWNHDCDFSGVHAADFNPNHTGVLPVPRSGQLDARVARGEVLTITQEGCEAVYFQGMLGTFTVIDLDFSPAGSRHHRWDGDSLRYSEKFQFFTHGGACRAQPIVVTNVFDAEWRVSVDEGGLKLTASEAIARTPVFPFPFLGATSHQFKLSCRLERVQ